MARRDDVTSGEHEWLAESFEEHRAHLRGVAYRMLGSVSEADDAVQEAWVRLCRSGGSGIHDLRAWLTVVVARISLDMLRSRRARREEPLEPQLPQPIVSSYEGDDPEQEALLADSVGLALLVVLETLAPAERLAFVLHDLFAVPFKEIASILGRSPAATRQLASRARRRVQGAPMPDADLGRQREVVDAFLAATREGDFEALLAMLDPEVVLRADVAIPPRAPTEVHGAPAVAARALTFSGVARSARSAVVNGAAGFVVAPHGRPFAVVGCTVRGGKIIEMDIIADPTRLREIDFSVLDVQ